MQTLTALETATILKIARHEMNSTNGAPEYAQSASDLTTWAWAGDFTSADCDVKQVKGVMSSLVKKGLIECSGKGQDAVVGFSDEGFVQVQFLLAREASIKDMVASVVAETTPAAPVEVAAPAEKPLGPVGICRSLWSAHTVRADFINAAVALGVNKATASTQWQLRNKK